MSSSRVCSKASVLLFSCLSWKTDKLAKKRKNERFCLAIFMVATICVAPHKIVCLPPPLDLFKDVHPLSGNMLMEYFEATHLPLSVRTASSSPHCCWTAFASSRFLRACKFLQFFSSKLTYWKGIFVTSWIQFCFWKWTFDQMLKRELVIKQTGSDLIVNQISSLIESCIYPPIRRQISNLNLVW